MMVGDGQSSLPPGVRRGPPPAPRRRAVADRAGRASTLLGKAAGGHYRNDFAVKGVGSQTAADLLEAKFPPAGGASAQVVVHAPTGTLHDGANAAALAAMEKALADVPHVDAVIGPTTRPRRSCRKDGTIALRQRQLQPVGQRARQQRAEDARRPRPRPRRAPGSQVEFGGQLPVGRRADRSDRRRRRSA